jgi:hypothetical protein
VVRQEKPMSAELGFIFKRKKEGRGKEGLRAFWWLGKQFIGSV